MLLKAQGITKRYGANTVLADAGFTVHEGEVLGLIGPNGAGKTTLFECLAGLLPTDGGSVEFRGEPLPAGRRKQALFYLPDGIRPWADQPVHWVLAFFEALYGRPQGEGAALATRPQTRAPAQIARSVRSPRARPSASCWLSDCSRRNLCCCWTSRSTAWIFARPATSWRCCAPFPRAAARCSSRFINWWMPRACATAWCC